MKNIILATLLLVAFGTTSFAKEKSVDPKLFKELSMALKNSTQVSWADKSQYRQARFNYKNTIASAFYSATDNELLGFGIEFNKTDLPEVVTEAIRDKYSDSEIGDAMIFIDAYGSINYFARVLKNNKELVLKITPNGNVSVFAKIPS